MTKNFPLRICGEMQLSKDVFRRQELNRHYACRAMERGGDSVVYQPKSEHLKGNGGYVICNLIPGGKVRNVSPKL